MGGSQQVIPRLAVVQLEQGRTVFFPTVRCLVGLCRDQTREVNFLSAHAVHFFTDDVFDLAQDAQAKRQPRVDTGGSASDIAGANQELVGIDLSVSWVFAQSAHKV